MSKLGNQKMNLTDLENFPSFHEVREFLGYDVKKISEKLGMSYTPTLNHDNGTTPLKIIHKRALRDLVREQQERLKDALGEK